MKPFGFQTAFLFLLVTFGGVPSIVLGSPPATHQPEPTPESYQVLAAHGGTSPPPVQTQVQAQEPSSQEKLVHISAGEYPPWISETLKGNGFIAQVIRESFELEGYSVEFTFFPWKRTYDQARRGKYDATAYWYTSEERKKDFYYSDPLSIETTHFFYHKSKPLKKWETLEDLQGFTVGATDGYTYTEEFWALAKSGKLNVEMTVKDKLNLAKLLHQRIDVFPVEKHLAFSILQKEFKPHIIHMIDYHPKPLMETTGHLLFPKVLKTSPELLQRFNRGLAELKANGRHDEIFDSNLFEKTQN